MGPYNPLEKQLEYDPNTGKVLNWKVKPENRVDKIAAYHDICNDMGKNKGECHRQMVKSLDEIPYGKMSKWGQTARFLINTKQKLGLGFDPIDFAKGVFNPVKEGISKAKKGKMPWSVDYKEGFKLLSDPKLFKGPQKSKAEMENTVKAYKKEYERYKNSVVKTVLMNTA